MFYFGGCFDSPALKSPPGIFGLGGGYGADYESDTVPSAAEYAAGLVPLLKDKNLKLIFEPGKSVAANAGVLITKVLYLKKSGTKKFVIVDAGMSELIRPPLYDAFHFIWPAEVDKKFVPAGKYENLDIRSDINFYRCLPY